MNALNTVLAAWMLISLNRHMDNSPKKGEKGSFGVHLTVTFIWLALAWWNLYEVMG